MPRLPRIHIEGAAHWVTAKGLYDQQIFKDKADYDFYLEQIIKYRKQHGFKLFSFCLLQDRLFLLIETRLETTISQVMHDLNSLYTKYFNSKYGRKGHLFEARFKSVLVEKGPLLMTVAGLIHAEAPPGDPYNSSSFYEDPRNSDRTMALDIQEEADEAKRLGPASGDSTEQIQNALKRNRILGSEAFVKKAKDVILERSAELQQISENSGRSGGPLYRLFVGLIIFTIGVSVYLFFAKQEAESKYRQLLGSKEKDFAEKTRFENKSPLSLAELEGTEWMVEIVAKEGSYRDRLSFSNGRFISSRLKAQAFKDSTYILVPRGDKKVQWQAAQSNPRGFTVAWRGEWQGSAMKGVLISQAPGSGPVETPFFSLSWRYLQQNQ